MTAQFRLKLVAIVLAAGASGCWSHVDALPWMDIPPYRDPPPGFSSTYHRALYGPRLRPVPPRDRPLEGVPPQSAGRDRVRQVQHTAPSGAKAKPTNEGAEAGDEPEQDERPKKTRLQSTFDYLMRSPEPIRF